MRRAVLPFILLATLTPAITASAHGESRFRERMRERMEGRLRSDVVPNATEHSYGTDPLQKLDYWKSTQSNAPLIIFVHGGGWSKGDKRNATGAQKVNHWQEQGYAVASVNYRLVPTATVEQQAQDIADSIGWLRKHAQEVGFNANRIILIGHSAGAHLTALVGTDMHYLAKANVPPSAIKGFIPLDGAAYDVPMQMKDGPTVMQKTYEQAFGDDPVRQRALSPTLHAAAPNGSDFLIMHVSREDGTRQARALASALRKAATSATVEAIEGQGLRGHMEINRSLGDPSYDATRITDAWIKQRLATNQ